MQFYDSIILYTCTRQAMFTAHLLELVIPSVQHSLGKSKAASSGTCMVQIELLSSIMK